MYALYQSVNYLIDNEIEGDFVECGVARWQCYDDCFYSKKQKHHQQKDFFV
jgi:hypothetical protein